MGASCGCMQKKASGYKDDTTNYNSPTKNTTIVTNKGGVQIGSNNTDTVPKKAPALVSITCLLIYASHERNLRTPVLQSLSRRRKKIKREASPRSRRLVSVCYDIVTKILSRF